MLLPAATPNCKQALWVQVSLGAGHPVGRGRSQALPAWFVQSRWEQRQLPKVSG